MPSAPIAPHVQAFAPDFARRFALITAGLAALVARAFLHDPRLVPLIIPLWSRFTRAAKRCTALMAILAAGKTPRPHHPGKSRPHAVLRLPTTDAWLIQTLRHEAAAYASQLAHLLADPAAAELLAAVPTTAQFLRPICRLLGIRSAAVGRNSEAYSAEPAPTCAAPIAAVLPLSTWPVAPLAMRPPPCPHVGWPWFPRHAAKRSGVDSDRGAPLPARATPSRCESGAPQERVAKPA